MSSQFLTNFFSSSDNISMARDKGIYFPFIDYYWDDVLVAFLVSDHETFVEWEINLVHTKFPQACSYRNWVYIGSQSIVGIASLQMRIRNTIFLGVVPVDISRYQWFWRPERPGGAQPMNPCCIGKVLKFNRKSIDFLRFWGGERMDADGVRVESGNP